MVEDSIEEPMTDEEVAEIKAQEDEAARIAAEAAEDAKVDELIEESNKERPVVTRDESEALPANFKCIKNKNGFFVETIGSGWVKLTKGQILKLAEIIAD